MYSDTSVRPTLFCQKRPLKKGVLSIQYVDLSPWWPLLRIRGSTVYPFLHNFNQSNSACVFLTSSQCFKHEWKHYYFFIAGACMSIVSASIQMCKTIKELVYNNTNTYHRAKLPLCAQAISKSSAQLLDALKAHSDEKTFGSYR